MSQTLRSADDELKTAIERALAWAPSVDAGHIEVVATGGVVLLSGEVHTHPEKSAAVEAAQGVAGVLGLADELVVRRDRHERTDDAIARDVAASLMSNVIVPAHSVTAEVRQRSVTLTGEVHWNYQRDAAVSIVSAVPGVTGVVIEISIVPVASFVAADAEQNIRGALLRGAIRDPSTIRVSGADTRLTLSGTVSSWSEFREAEDAAWSTPGVTDVDNQLELGG